MEGTENQIPVLMEIWIVIRAIIAYSYLLREFPQGTAAGKQTDVWSRMGTTAQITLETIQHIYTGFLTY